MTGIIIYIVSNIVLRLYYSVKFAGRNRFKVFVFFFYPSMEKCSFIYSRILNNDVDWNEYPMVSILCSDLLSYRCVYFFDDAKSYVTKNVHDFSCIHSTINIVYKTSFKISINQKRNFFCSINIFFYCYYGWN